MANRIKGITIEIDGDTTKLQSSLRGIDKELKTTQTALRDVNKLLKLDPSNTTLLTQKQKDLEKSIGLTRKRLTELKAAQESVEEGTEEWDSLQREIIDTEQNLKGLEKEYREFGSVASQQIKAVGEKLQQTGDKISALGDKLMPLSTAAGGALTAIGGLAYKSVTAADDLNTLSKQTGISTDELQKMQYAADLVDVSVDDITGGLRRLKRNMSDSNETLAALGVSATNADGSFRDATDVFYDTLTALSQIENETERDKLAMELFGKSADSLAGIIDDGGEALKDYGKEAEEMGLIISGDTLDSLNEMNDVIDQTKATLGASLTELGGTAAQTLQPVLKRVTTLVGKLSDKLRKLTPEQTEMILKIVGVVAAIGPLLKIGGKTMTLVGTVVKGIGTLVGVLGGPLTLAIGAVIAVGVLLWKNWDKVKEAAAKLKDSLTNTWNNIKTSVTATVENIKTSVTNAWNNMKTAVTTAANDLKTSVTNTWNSVKTATTNAWDNVKTTLQTKWNNIKSAYETAGGGLKGVASATMTGLKEYYKTGWDAINNLTGGKLTTIKNAVSNAWNSVKSTTASIWNNIRDSISDKITSAKNTVSTMIDKIKGFFSFNWKLPTLKLPHVILTKGEWPWGLMGKGVAPKVSISWYKKAYENPVLFKQPTVLATSQGYKGFGDGQGAEIVMGLNKLRELVGTAGDVTINVYAADGMDINALADKIQDRFVALRNQRRAAYA